MKDKKCTQFKAGKNDIPLKPAIKWSSTRSLHELQPYVEDCDESILETPPEIPTAPEKASHAPNLRPVGKRTTIPTGEKAGLSFPTRGCATSSSQILLFPPQHNAGVTVHKHDIGNSQAINVPSGPPSKGRVYHETLSRVRRFNNDNAPVKVRLCKPPLKPKQKRLMKVHPLPPIPRVSWADEQDGGELASYHSEPGSEELPLGARLDLQTERPILNKSGHGSELGGCEESQPAYTSNAFDDQDIICRHKDSMTAGPSTTRQQHFAASWSILSADLQEQDLDQNPARLQFVGKDTILPSSSPLYDRPATQQGSRHPHLYLNPNNGPTAKNLHEYPSPISCAQTPEVPTQIHILSETNTGVSNKISPAQCRLPHVSDYLTPRGPRPAWGSDEDLESARKSRREARIYNQEILDRAKIGSRKAEQKKAERLRCHIQMKYEVNELKEQAAAIYPNMQSETEDGGWQIRCCACRVM